MKKLILLVNLLLTAGLVWAHGSEQNYNDAAGSNSSWNQMNTFHGLMHDSTIKSENTEEGVRLEISSTSDEVVEVIQKEFVENQEDLNSYFKDLDIFIETLDNGVALTFSSNDEKKSIQLQHQGNSLIYQYLHNKVHNSDFAMDSHHGHWKGHGFGKKSGADWMHGNRGHMRYVPGMMHNDPGNRNYESQGQM